MPSKKSGGARQTEQVRLEREAKRPRGWAASQRRAFTRATKGLHGIALAVAAAEHALEWSGKDPGLPPEQAREQQIRGSQTLGKLSQPEETIRDQAALIDRLTAALESARDSDGVPVTPGPGREGEPAPH